MSKSVSIRFAALFVAAGLLTAPAKADIEKIMRPCDRGLCATFRAPVVIPDGWQEDTEASAALGVQMLLPKGQDFEAAPAKIYVLVRYNKAKQPVPVMARDTYADWKKRAKAGKTSKIADVSRDNGKPAFERHLFEAPKLKEQGFETSALAADGDKDGNDFVVTVVLSANTRAAFQAAEPAYLAILKAY